MRFKGHPSTIYSRMRYLFVTMYIFQTCFIKVKWCKYVHTAAHSDILYLYKSDILYLYTSKSACQDYRAQHCNYTNTTPQLMTACHAWRMSFNQADLFHVQCLVSWYIMCDRYFMAVVLESPLLPQVIYGMPPMADNRTQELFYSLQLQFLSSRYRFPRVCDAWGPNIVYLN